MPMPIDAPFEIPEWTVEEEGVGDEVAAIMRVVGERIGDVTVELMDNVLLLSKVTMSVVFKRRLCVEMRGTRKN